MKKFKHVVKQHWLDNQSSPKELCEIFRISNRTANRWRNQWLLEECIDMLEAARCLK